MAGAGAHAIIRPEPEMKNRSLHSTSPGTHGTGRTRKLSVVSKGHTLELGRFSTRNNFHREALYYEETKHLR